MLDNAAALHLFRLRYWCIAGNEELRRKVNYNVLNERKCMTRTGKSECKSLVWALQSWGCCLISVWRHFSSIRQSESTKIIWSSKLWQPTTGQKLLSNILYSVQIFHKQHKSIRWEGKVCKKCPRPGLAWCDVQPLAVVVTSVAESIIPSITEMDQRWNYDHHQL